MKNESIKYVDIDVFMDLYYGFIKIKTWTKDKRDKLNKVEDYLKDYYCLKIRVKPSFSTNKCTITQSFTVFQVSERQLGKLYQLRKKWVLVRCISYDSGWSKYRNDVYLLKEPVDKNKKEEIKKRFGDYFVLRMD
jgi:hypothetical protein